MKKIGRGNPSQIGYAGELLVASLLSQYNLNLSTIGGTAEVCDILVSSPKTNELRRIEVKTRSNANSKVDGIEGKTQGKNKGWSVNNPIFSDNQLVYAFVDYKRKRMIPSSIPDIWFVPSTELKTIMYNTYSTDDYPARIVINYNKLTTKERMKKYYYAFNKVFPGINKIESKEREEENIAKTPSSLSVIHKFYHNTTKTRKGESMIEKKKRLQPKIDAAKEKWRKYGG